MVCDYIIIKFIEIKSLLFIHQLPIRNQVLLRKMFSHKGVLLPDIVVEVHVERDIQHVQHKQFGAHSGLSRLLDLVENFEVYVSDPTEKDAGSAKGFSVLEPHILVFLVEV
jgi:hypothetical protein